jgi:antitoxin ParD1/3/4
MTTLTISLPDSLKEFIEQEVESKGYGNVSEYVRELLRMAQQRAADARLETLLIEGLAGEAKPLTPEFWDELRGEAAAILAKRKKTSAKHTKRAKP